MIVTSLAALALLSSGTYVLSRWYGVHTLISGSGQVLKWTLYALAFCAGYAILVGVYHTILSVTGLDRGKKAPVSKAQEPG